MRRNLHKRRKLFQLVHLLKWRFILVLELGGLLDHLHNTRPSFHYLMSMLFGMVGQHLILMSMGSSSMIQHLNFT